MKFLFEHRIPLVQSVTPIHSLRFRGTEFLMKRDDLTGMETSGNKVRKLEFLLFEAKKLGATRIFTCGGGQSNHCRATVVAAKKVGIPVTLFLWEEETAKSSGNLFFNRLFASEIHYLQFADYLKVADLMREHQRAAELDGEKVYIIPEGGSSERGILGSAHCMIEMNRQLVQMNRRIKSVVTAVGSGGTAAGLLVGAVLERKKTKIIGVSVLYPGKEIRERILDLAGRTAKLLHIPSSQFGEMLEITDYSHEGYKTTAEHTMEIIASFAGSTGILTDPVYTGKSFAFWAEHFSGTRQSSPHLFLHTGGLFGWFGRDADCENLLKKVK